ncbi:MaoC family dehydratase [Mangrovicella endophytica]|uniref:MaoC family dehydratase n=1 Tax=Mangrovicella endophytica TaxID=2066697 RepID=UPI000C9E685B|nr:MaoC family dehydratase [Mangrovicella endophytica]
MRTFEDFTVETVLPLAPYDVTREAIVAFAAEFDPQPFHVDDEAAAATMLGGLAASGWHSCAMMMRMMFDGFLRDSTSQGSPGVDFVRWLKPVRPDDRLTGTATVLSARRSASRPALGIAKLRAEVANQRGETVMDSEYTLLLLTRDGIGQPSSGVVADATGGAV